MLLAAITAAALHLWHSGTLAPTSAEATVGTCALAHLRTCAQRASGLQWLSIAPAFRQA